MRNEMSTSGIGEDMLRSIIQFGCAELHAKTLYEKTRAELENGIIDCEDETALKAAIDRMEEFRKDVENYSELRRRSMRALMRMFEGDKDMWCQIKHLGTGAMTMWEAYEASDGDGELLDIAYDANKEFVKAVTRFLGMEITDCAACLSDMLKGDKK